MVNSRLKVAVLMGGKSSEREISLMSGKEVIKALRKKGHMVKPVVINGQDWKNEFGEMDICFIAMHGKWGEDGTVQGMLELLGVPYVGCGVLASSLGMNKLMFKKFLDGIGIKNPKLVGEKPDRFPVFVKPNCGGSSVGVTKVRQITEVNKAVGLALKYDDTVIIEEGVEGREFTCGVIGNQKTQEVLPVVEIISSNNFFDYEAKYFSKKTKEIVPARIENSLANKISSISRKIFREIGAKGMFRVDFMVDKSNELFVLEINTIPGLTTVSLMPKAAKAAGYSYEDFLEKVIRYSL